MEEIRCKNCHSIMTTWGEHLRCENCGVVYLTLDEPWWEPTKNK